MTRRITLAIVAALAALLLSAGLAAAQDPPETATATRLEPGLNLVGWVGEPTPVSQLFQQIPRLEAIWAWDAELRDWIVAAPGAPEWLGGLGRVTAGMGLRMQLGGEQPYLWERSTEPTRGLVKLRTGWNLVAWSGADGAAIDDVVKGIGWSLRTVRRWDAANQQWAVWTSPERSAQVIASTGAGQDAGNDAEAPGVRRGEALWIEVARAVNWLQPTEILPRLVFPGGASQALQTRVREDLEATLSFFRDRYGIQAESDFTVYAAKDVDSLIQAYRDDGEEVDDAYEASQRARWDRSAGWAGGKIVVKQLHWPDDLSNGEITWSRYLITHEYFHILQSQLSDRWASEWLVEGTADWAEGEHEVLDEGETWGNLRDGTSSAISNDTPTLRSTESPNATWEYRLGWLATDQLTQKTAADFPVEFWRALSSTEIGPHRRWESMPDWRTAFQSVFGQPVSEFYAEFDIWQREQAAANPATANSYDGNQIRGRVTDEDGGPVAGVFVNATRVEGETSFGWNQRAETAADGTFAVRAPEDGDYRLSVNIASNCRRYYSDGDLVAGEGNATLIKVSDSDVSGVDIQLPPNICRQIRGRIVGPNTEPLVGIFVEACTVHLNHQQCYSSTSAADGSFAVSANESGEYRISADLGDGCSVYFRSGGPTTTNQNGASPITVIDAHVSDILIQVPEDLCRLRVAGFLGGIERFLDGYLSAQLCRLIDNRCESSTSRLEDDGRFAVAALTSGVHRLTYFLNGCSVHYGPMGLTANAAGAALINVDSRDVRVGHRQVPANVCAHSISGALISAAGQPLADTYVSACLEVDGDCVAWIGHRTDDDGAFEITAPTDGEYRLSFNLEGCSVYFRAGGLTTMFNERSTVRVQGRDTRLNPRQIPADVCGYQITGSITKSDGQPLADTYVSACLEEDGDCVAWIGRRTDDGGAFEITVPTEGDYLVSFNLEGCSVYFRAGGLTTMFNERSTVRVQGRDTRLNPRQIPDGMCAHRISGRFVDASGAPLSETWINVRWPGGAGGAWTDPDGRFEIPVPSDGGYYFSVQLQRQPQCWAFLDGQDFGSPNNPVRVSGADVTSVVLRLPSTIEELCE